MSDKKVAFSDFESALEKGRPPNIKKLFPNSKALIVSGKFIDRAMLAKGNAIAMAANGRNHFVIRGALMAAQRANAAIILEIAKSEGGANAYCAVNYWNIARQVDAICNELGISIPVAIHADHYGIKNERDIEIAMLRKNAEIDELRQKYAELAEATSPNWRNLDHATLVSLAKCNKQDADTMDERQEQGRDE